MAKQNFIAGGIVGKLGDTVGQRFRNTRTLRKYVIPKNPNTEAQEQNRKNFGKAVELTQRSMYLNQGAIYWKMSGLTEYQARVKIAKKRVDEGLDDFLSTPLYPDGTTPQITIADLKVVETKEGDIQITSEQIKNLKENATFSLLINLVDQQTQIENWLVYIADTEPNNEILITFKKGDRYQPTDKTKIVGITQDQSINNLQFFYIAPQFIKWDSTILINDVKPAYIDTTHFKLTSEKLAEITGQYDFTIDWQYIDVTDGQQKTKQTTITKTLPDTEIATIETQIQDVLYQNCKINIDVKPKTQQKTKIVVSQSTATFGQKIVAKNVNLQNLTPNWNAKETLNAKFDLDCALFDIKNNINISASYQSFKNEQQNNETLNIENIKTEQNQNISFDMKLQNIPKTQNMTIDNTSTINFSNDYLKYEITLNASILQKYAFYATNVTYNYKPSLNTDVVKIQINNIPPEIDVTNAKSFVPITANYKQMNIQNEQITNGQQTITPTGANFTLLTFGAYARTGNNVTPKQILAPNEDTTYEAVGNFNDYELLLLPATSKNPTTKLTTTSENDMLRLIGKYDQAQNQFVLNQSLIYCDNTQWTDGHMYCALIFEIYNGIKMNFTIDNNSDVRYEYEGEQNLAEYYIKINNVQIGQGTRYPTEYREQRQLTNPIIYADYIEGETTAGYTEYTFENRALKCTYYDNWGFEVEEWQA